MAALLHYADRQLRRERIFRDRLNPLDTHTDEELVSRYRLDRTSILHVINCINDNLETATYRSKSLSSPVQVLIALRYYATGSFQKLIADAHGVSVPSVSRVIHRVSRAITTCIDDKLSINFPSTMEDIISTKEGFHQIAGFPNVVGTIDGTQVAIIAPSGENEPLFVCRKGFHSINVQATADSKLRCIHHKSGGCLMYVPQKCVNIIIAVCKLHNLCITNNLPLPEVEPDDIEDHNPVNQNPHVQNLNATTFRNNLVRQRFVI